MNASTKIADDMSISNVTSPLNSSQSSHGHCDNVPSENPNVSWTINICSATICSLIFLLGTTVSAYVIWMKVYRLERSFRSVLSINLLLAGFIWSLFLLLNIVYFAYGYDWPFGSFLCQLNNVMFHLNMFISAFILTLYSIDYCLVVIYTFRYSYYRKPFLAIVEALVSWTIAFCISTPYFAYKATYECHNAVRCLDRVDNTKMPDAWTHGQKVVGMMAFVVGYCLPLLIIGLCFIIAAFVYHRKKTSEYSPALKRIFAMQTLFGVCWLPYHVFSLIKLLWSISGEENLDGVVGMAQPITISLASLSAAFNPILLAFLSPDFKRKKSKPYHNNLL